MTKKLGRNDPCPCGSGKKYKHCCLRGSNAQVARSTWLLMRRTEGELAPKLADYADTHCAEGALLEAWDEFHLSDGTPMVTEEPDQEFEQFFMPWFLYCWMPNRASLSPRHRLSRMPLAMHYLKHTPGVPPFTKRFIEEACAAPFSFFMVTNVVPGSELSLRDLFWRREMVVHERSGSQNLMKGEIIFARVVTMGGDSILLGSSTIPIPASYANYFFDIRDKLNAEGHRGRQLLEIHAGMLRDILFEIEGQLLDPRPPRLHNTDGDPIQMIKMFFELQCTPEEAKEALAPLTLGEADLDIEESRQFDADGQLNSVRFPWLKEGSASQIEPRSITLGSIRIEGKNLIVEVNSEQRADLFKEEIERRLGPKAEFKLAEVTSIEQMWEEMKLALEAGEPPWESREAQEIEELKDLPEVKQILEEQSAAHWQAWPDMSLPALDGQTPREAAKSESGRERLEALLWDFESRASTNLFNPSVDVLRKELGME